MLEISMCRTISLILILWLKIGYAAESPADYESDVSELTASSDNISELTSGSSSPTPSYKSMPFHEPLHESIHAALHEPMDGSVESRPRKSSFNSHSSKKELHVSFGWVQFSDDRWMPTEDMQDTPENLDHILTLMLLDARHGNLEYFRYLVNILKRIGGDVVSPISKSLELDFYHLNSLIFAAVHGDNVELFIEVMNLKGITISDLNPCRLKASRRKEAPIVGSLQRSSFLSTIDSSDDDESGGEDNGEEHLVCALIEETVFGQAIRKNSIEILKYLISQGLRDQYPDNTITPLHLAIQSKHELAVRLLLNEGGSRIDACNGAFKTPLMLAILAGSPKMVKVILDYNPNLFMVDFKRRTVLHLASKIGNIDILKMIKRAARSSIRSRNDWYSLVYATDILKNSVLHYAKDRATYEFLVEECGALEGEPNFAGNLPQFYELKPKINA